MTVPAPLLDRERVRMLGAMAITGKSARCLQAMALKGLIPGATKLGGEWTFDEASLRLWCGGLKSRRPRKSREKPPRAIIYFIKQGRFIKIGRSINMPDRLRNLQAASPETLRVLLEVEGGCTDGGLAVEREYHKRFARYHVKGEWFEHIGMLHRFLRRT